MNLRYSNLSSFTIHVIKAALTIVVVSVLLTPSSAFAGRTGSTGITNMIVKPDHIAVYTESSTGDCSTPNMWIIERSHDNYDELYSGFMASKLAGKNVDIVGTGLCSSYDARGEVISWAYVAK